MAKRFSLPPLTALRAFEAAARHMSYRLAAEELSITQSAVSHQISNLDKYFGKQLFQRAGRHVELTEAGQSFFPFVHEAMEKIDSGAQLITRTSQQELTVQIYITMAARWMMPRLHRLQKACPDLLVRFNASQMDWEFDPLAADVGIICTAAATRQGFEYIQLFEAELIAVCSPKLLPSGGVADAASLIRQTLLEVYTAGNNWGVWLSAAGIARNSSAATVRFDSYLLALEAAADGQGVAIVPDFLAAPDLASGRLVQPVPLSVQQPEKWYLTARKGKFREQAASRFRDWIIEETLLPAFPAPPSFSSAMRR
jgi:LysR family transcriptional regulator, glycine cleavage system transcriptional activator